MVISASVIITTCNRPVELIGAINSVFHQTYKPLEIIVVNDGERIKLPKTLSSSLSITLIHNEGPHGANYVRNMGAELSKGDVLMFLDDDDTWAPTKIEAQMKIFDSNPEVGAVYTRKVVVSTLDREKTLFLSKESKSGDLSNEIFASNILGSTSAVAIRREIFFSAGRFDVELPALQDYDLWIRIAQITLIACDKYYNLRYTIHSDGWQTSNDIDKRFLALDVISGKYELQLRKLSWHGRRKFLANLYFLKAQVVKNSGPIHSFFWVLKSLLSFPTFRAVALLFPKNLIKIVRSLSSSHS